jgi:hypothetical protein
MFFPLDYKTEVYPLTWGPKSFRVTRSVVELEAPASPLGRPVVGAPFFLLHFPLDSHIPACQQCRRCCDDGHRRRAQSNGR